MNNATVGLVLNIINALLDLGPRIVDLIERAVAAHKSGTPLHIDDAEVQAVIEDAQASIDKL